MQLSEHAVPFCRDPSTPGSDADGLVVHHLDVRFLAVVAPDAVPAVSEESLDLRWWSADDLPEPEPDLVELVRLARARFGAGARVSPGTPGAE